MHCDGFFFSFPTEEDDEIKEDFLVMAFGAAVKKCFNVNDDDVDVDDDDDVLFRFVFAVVLCAFPLPREDMLPQVASTDYYKMLSPVLFLSSQVLCSWN